jgi:predicted TPR repeat methyltransferase
MERSAAEWLAEGNAHYEAQRWDEAGIALARALSLEPRDAQAWFRLGNVREEQRRDAEALDSFLRAVELDAKHARAWNNLGGARQRLGRSEQAALAYRKAIEADPALLQPYLNLGRLCQERGDLPAAAACFRAGLAHHPANAMLEHLAAAASGGSSARAPRQYVAELFDDVSARFDEHLVQHLEYRVPWLLADLVRSHLAPSSRVLDLGCGTGLVGAALATPGLQLTGVDLSPRMLEIAAKRGIYAGLLLADVQEALASSPAAHFRAVLAADVFIYIGDLADVFREVARVLEPGGLFAYSVEVLGEGSYQLQRTGRYAQNLGYLRDLAARSSLRELRADSVDIRRQQSGFAAGRLLLLERL